MLLAGVAVLIGLLLLVWSADRFVEGAAATARHYNVAPLLIGMLIVGFGTSAPEMVVSAISAAQGNPGLALGNAYGSNVANIALILGVTALISPIAVHSQVLRRELPILILVTALTGVLIYDAEVSRLDAVILLAVFFSLIGWTIVQALRPDGDALAQEMEQELTAHPMPLGRAWVWLLVGLVGLVASSRVLVWGAVELAQSIGVSDLIIGLTIVAIGTSLPELASSIMATRKGEHDIAVGNVIGSNLFNTLAVVGIAGAIDPVAVSEDVFWRDFMVMSALTLSLFIGGYGFRGQGRISRFEGALLLGCYLTYTIYLIVTSIGPNAN